MFSSEYQHSLDVKGRVIIPSKLREELGMSFIMTKGLDGCLYIYSKEQWKIFEDKAKKLPLTNKDARKFIRFFFGGACESSGDKQGRVLIPQNLREHANLKKEIVICGALDKAEIWDKQKYDEIAGANNIDMDEIAQNIDELEITI